MSADSNVGTISAEPFLGVVLHDPIDPEPTLAHFLYWNGGRSKQSQVEATQLQYAGRTYPVTSFGDPSSEVLTVTVAIPEGVDHDDQVAALQGFLDDRKLVCYRDGRSRKVFGTTSEQQVQDAKGITSVTFIVTRNDHTEAV